MKPKNKNEKTNRDLPCDNYSPSDGDGLTRKGKLRRDQRKDQTRGNPRSRQWGK